MIVCECVMATCCSAQSALLQCFCVTVQGALNYHMKLFSQPVMSTPIARMRAYRDCLVILGAGYLDNTLCSNMLAAPVRSSSLGAFTSLSQTRDRRYFAAVAVVNDFVFVVGGQTAMAGDGSHATNSAFRYNPRDGRWLQVGRVLMLVTCGQINMKKPSAHAALQ